MKFPNVRAAVVTAGAMAAALFPVTPAHAVTHSSLHCEKGTAVCAELQDSEEAFGEGVYVGHDEPSLLFYSKHPGAGNRMSYQLTLPTDPAPDPANAFNFELRPA